MSTRTDTLPSAPPRPGRGQGRPFSAAPPRVDLLPPEIEQRNREAGTRRVFRLLVFVVFIVVLAGIGGAWYLSTLAQTAAAAEQQRTQALLLQQKQYDDVRAAQAAVALGTAAQDVAGATEIDWQDYLQKLALSLPAAVKLDGVQIDSEGATAPYGQSEVPLEGVRIATLTFTATSSTLPYIPDWLDALRELPGFVDALPGSVSIGEGGYKATITMHINEEAFSHRFGPETPAPADQAAADAPTGDQAEGEGQ